VVLSESRKKASRAGPLSGLLLMAPVASCFGGGPSQAELDALLTPPTHG